MIWKENNNNNNNNTDLGRPHHIIILNYNQILSSLFELLESPLKLSFDIKNKINLFLIISYK